MTSTPACLSLELIKTRAPASGHIALLTLERAEHSNAFDGALVDELSSCFATLANDENCRILVLQGRGKNFCAGADLNWMKEQGSLSPTKNRENAKLISHMFFQLASLPFPSVGVARGAVFGGGVGLIACCDMALASESARFCLSEVKLGILPAVILPYLQRKLSAGQLKRVSLSGMVFSAAEAQAWGLVEHCCGEDELHNALNTLLQQLLSAAPQAQRRLKHLLDKEQRQAWQNSQGELCNAIAEARSAAEGQAGLRAFLRKQAAPWVTTLADDWRS